jgi:hypothetical protein
MSKKLSKRQRITSIIISFLVVSGVTAAIYAYISNPAHAAWFDDSWGYRQKVTVNNSGAADSNKKVLLDFDTDTLVTAGKMQADLDDIRITDTNGKLLPYYIDESGEAPPTNPVNIDDASNFNFIQESPRRLVRTSSGNLYTFLSNSGSCEIWKSADNGTTWSQQDSADNPFCTNAAHRMSLAIDSTDTLHLAYLSGNTQIAYLTFTTSNDQFGVSTETIGTIAAEDTYSSVDLAVDSNDIPHAIYVYSDGFGSNFFKYDNRIGNAWNSTDIDLEGEFSTNARGADLVIDEDNLPIIGYNLFGDDDLIAAVGNQNDATSFTRHTVDADISGNINDGGISTGIDSGGNVWIAYTRNDGTEDDITLATRTDGNETSSWSTGWTIDITNNNSKTSGHDLSLAIDGTTVYVFYIDDQDDVVYDSYDGAVWSGETILETGGTLIDINARWSFLNNPSYSTYGIDYIYADGTDVFYNRISLPGSACEFTCLWTLMETINAGKTDLYVYYGNPSASAGGQSSQFSQATFSPTSTTTASEEIGPAPQAYWRLDDGTGTVAQDGTANNYDGTISGATWKSEDMCVSVKCLLFDGTDDVVTVASTVPSIKTVSMWVRTATTTEQILDINGTASISVSSGTISATGFTNPTIYVDGQPSTTITADKWHHITVTTSSGLSGSAIKMGQISTNYGQLFIDEVKLYPFVRTLAQVKTDFSKSSGSKGVSASFGNSSDIFMSDGLIGYWKLDESSGDAADYSGNGYTLTNNGTTTYVSGKYGRGSEHVPASSQYLSTTTTISGIKSVSFWTNPDSTTNYYLSLTSGAYVTSTSGVLSATGFTSPKIYVNGVATTVITADTWQLVTVTSETAIDADLFYLGRQGSNYYDGTLDELHAYNRTLTPGEISQLYNWAPGPTGYWKMDEGSWTRDCSTDTVLDSSGNGYNGDSCPSTTGPDITIGKYGNAGRFDGSNDYVLVPSTFQIPSLQGSVSAWVNPTTNTYDIVSSGTSNNDFRISPQNNLYGFFIGSEYRVSYSTDPTLNTWTYVTLTWDQTNGSTLYYNGVKVAANAAAPPAYNQTSLYIGTKPGAGNDYMNGKIDDVKVYDYPRTVKQIVEDMNAGHPIGGSPVGSQVAYWKMDEQQGQVLNNSVSTSLTGTVGGSSSVDIQDPTWKTNCKVNGCQDFDGAGNNDFITNATAIDLNDNLASASTWTAWINPRTTGINDIGAIFFKFNTSCSISGTSSPFDFRCALGLTSAASVDVSSIIPADTWTHIAMTWNDDSDDEISVYVNGKLVGTSTNGVGPTASDASNLIIGNNAGGSTPFDGLIDEFKIYNSELTAAEIAIDMNANAGITLGGVLGNQDNEGFGGNPPVAWYKLDENAGTSAADSSGSNFTGTLTSSPVWSTGKAGSGLSFNGLSSYVDIGTGPSTVNTVSFWVYPLTSTEYFVNLTGTTDYIWSNAGTVTATGFTSPTIYVNGVQTTAISANVWSHITVTSTTSENASNLDLGRTQDTNYLEGRIDEVKIYDYVRSRSQIAYDYNRGAPIAHYKFDECQGTTTYNSAPAASGTAAGNNGTLVVGATGNTAAGACNSGTATEVWNDGTTGKVNSALGLDGLSDYVDFGDVFDFNYTEARSFAFWIYPNNISNTKFILSKIDANSPFNGWGISIANDPGKLVLEYISSWPSNALQVATVDAVLTASSWQHVVVTYDNKSVLMYVNGKRVKTTTSNNTLSSSVDHAISFNIGARDDGTESFVDGRLDEVRIYNYAVSESQVKNIYNNGAIYFGPATGNP